MTYPASAVTITLGNPATIFGVEIEPDPFAVYTITATFMNGNTVLGVVSQQVNGDAGALLAAATDSTPITSVLISSVADFAIAQIRSGSPKPKLTLSRQSLTVIQATGTPAGGTFAYQTAPAFGGNFAAVTPADNVLATTNPNTTNLIAPSSGGKPTPGGLETITATYNTNGSTPSVTFRVPTFGVSCYMIALESDYGSAPANCLSTHLYGQTISGTVTNPNGLNGTYCAAFIANVKLQGSAQLDSGQYIHYNTSTYKIDLISAVTGSDGTPVVAGQTVARDKNIIQATGVLIDVDKIGNGLLANDSGNAILGYRLDLFNGAGRAACATFTNPLSVAACEAAQPQCPGSALQ